MRYYVKKIISLIMVLFLIMLLTFIAFQVIPGVGRFTGRGGVGHPGESGH